MGYSVTKKVENIRYMQLLDYEFLSNLSKSAAAHYLFTRLLLAQRFLQTLIDRFTLEISDYRYLQIIISMNFNSQKLKVNLIFKVHFFLALDNNRLNSADFFRDF